MTSRERIRTALEHRQPDRVPVDFGGTNVTGISASTVYKLRKALGLPDRPVRIIEPLQMVGYVEEDLREKLGCDCAQIFPLNNSFGMRNTGWKQWNLFDGTPVLVPEVFNTKPNSDGSYYQYPQGDTSVPPSVILPSDGYYHDSLDRQGPFDEDNPKVDDNLEEFGHISDTELEYMQKSIDELYKNSDKAIVAMARGGSLGDAGAVPAAGMKNPKGIRNVEEWYVSMAIRRDFLKELFDRQTTIAVENLKLFHEAAGDKIEVIYICAADFGTQNGPLISTDLFREVYMPYYRRMNDWVHKNTHWKTFKHCCGSIKALIPSLIEAGFDILNPVQNSAANMDAKTLKDEFGDKITFWGGGVDTQQTLPFGTAEEVYDQVTERIKTYSPGGGFVFNAIHNVQSKIPVENLLAMLEAVNQFR